MKQIFSLSLILLFTFCGGQILNSKDNIKVEKRKPFENFIYEVDALDKEMINAMESAKKNIKQFEEAMKSENPNFKNFAVKKAFPSDEGDEFIWISPIIFSKEKINILV